MGTSEMPAANTTGPGLFFSATAKGRQRQRPDSWQRHGSQETWRVDLWNSCRLLHADCCMPTVLCRLFYAGCFMPAVFSDCCMPTVACWLFYAGCFLSAVFSDWGADDCFMRWPWVRESLWGIFKEEFLDGAGLQGPRPCIPGMKEVCLYLRHFRARSSRG